MSAQEVQTIEERTPSSSSSSSFVSRGLEARFLEIVISLHSLQFARISVHLYAILFFSKVFIYLSESSFELLDFLVLESDSSSTFFYKNTKYTTVEHTAVPAATERAINIIFKIVLALVLLSLGILISSFLLYNTRLL